jgi:uncharacterized protein (DUF2164 family)
MPKIELERDERDEIVQRIKSYFAKEREEEIGDLAATFLLDFICEQIAPFFYNRGLSDAQQLLGRAAASLDSDLDAAKRFPSGR